MSGKDFGCSRLFLLVLTGVSICRTSINCLQCNKECVPDPKIGTRGQRFCSKKCWYDWKTSPLLDSFDLSIHLPGSHELVIDVLRCHFYGLHKGRGCAKSNIKEMYGSCCRYIHGQYSGHRPNWATLERRPQYDQGQATGLIFCLMITRIIDIHLRKYANIKTTV